MKLKVHDRVHKSTTLVRIVRQAYFTCSRPVSLKSQFTRVYLKVSGLATWSENCKWYSSLPLGAVVSLFYEFSLHNHVCYFSTSVYCCKRIFRYGLCPETFGYTIVISHSLPPRNLLRLGVQDGLFSYVFELLERK
jgi:hypothetical protein